MKQGRSQSERNIALYPWFKFLQNLLFWQATWFLYFQSALSPAEAIVLYVIYDVSTTVLEMPSGYASDRFGRKPTLLISSFFSLMGSACLFAGSDFFVFVAGQALLGAGMAFSSGTDSALLYESLSRAGRTNETEAQELRAWRFSFTALAVSAPLGGILAYLSPALPFAAGALSFACMFALGLRFADTRGAETQEKIRLKALREAYRLPVLRWLFLLAVLLYGYSHLPFVFGQPFIEQALATLGLASEAPLVSGTITTLMMMLSLFVSLYALRLRNRLGLTATLLLGFAIDIMLAAVLAATGSAWAIMVLVFRMVPNSFTTPFITARIQPLLHDTARASYLSVQSFSGRLFFAATLWAASIRAEGDGPLSHDAMQDILGLYVLFGIAALLALAGWARRLPIDPRAETKG